MRLLQLCNAGGGFVYVGAMHDSFPHALELSKRGYNAFALIYRVEHPYEDLAKAISFIYNNANMLKIDKRHYSLWGGSAGARMAAVLGNKKFLSSYSEIAVLQPKLSLCSIQGMIMFQRRCFQLMHVLEQTIILQIIFL